MPRVGIIMGSDSDLPTMSKAADILDTLDIEYELVVSSAHRSPDRTAEWARSAEERGIQVIIAGAGGAAHLPGVVAAYTSLPVVGVPLRAWATDGLDALLSMAQMPPGVPVATVAIDGARNAALLAVQILGVGDPEVRQRFRAYKQELARGTVAKNTRLQELGIARYLAEKEGHK